MKLNDPLWKTVLPWNWRMLKKQIKAIVFNYKKYGNFSLNRNSPAFYDEVYFNREEKYIPEHYYEIAEYLPQNESFTLCDVGCGTGEGLAYLVKKFHKAEFSGVDYSPVAIGLAKKKATRAKLYCFDITKDTFPAVYDYILVIETLEHFRNPFKIIDILLQFVRKKVFLSVPYNENEDELGKVSLYAKHLYNFNEQSLEKISKSRVLKITDHMKSTKQRCVFFEIAK